MSEDGYQGWKNYPTWCVNLWLSNDESLYRYALELVALAVDDAPTDTNVVEGIWTAEQTARFRLADTFKDWACDDLSPDLGASFPADLLSYALGEVDWQEIASAWIQDYSEIKAQ